jgi:serpin B
MNVDPGVIFEIANSIWYRQDFTIRTEFLETNRTYFDATILPMDFSDPGTITSINNWVGDKTHDKIEKIIDEINPMTLMFLINAIYFKGTWKYEFEKDQTIIKPFYLLNGSGIDCNMMHIEGDFNYYSDNDVQIIDLPYGDGYFNMTVMLPREANKIDEFIHNLNPIQWQYYLSNLDTSGVNLELPKFKLEYKIVLNQILKNLGMGVAFSPAEADFSRIVESMQLFISKVLHKTFVQVDEEGTEAAAVTVVEIKYTSIGPPTGKLMRVDHPFIFVIREKQSGTILFMGKVLEPQWSN